LEGVGAVVDCCGEGVHFFVGEHEVAGGWC
jgi:hypothetical protein